MSTNPVILVQPVLSDNYQFVVSPTGEALVVDPADAGAAWQAVSSAGGRLAAILITHHHQDHVAGVPELARRAGCPVIGPADPQLPMVTRPVGEGDRLALGDWVFQVFAVPGHTASHVAYHAPARSTLFAGDALFPGGCGRRAPGVSAAQFHASLRRLAALPEETRVYAGHEYAEENLRFALSVEPGNAALERRAREISALRRAGRFTIPFRLGGERDTNLFLRAPDAAAFDVLRRRKDVFG